MKLKEKIAQLRKYIKIVYFENSKYFKFFYIFIYFFFISIGLFILGCHATGWCEYGSTFINSVYLFLGICQYILGIFDLYQKKIFFLLRILY